MEKTAITLTDRAADHVKRFLANETNGIGLRVAVKPTGCSGYQYIVNMAEKTTDADQVFQIHGINVVIDSQSLTYLEGTELDYIREGINEGFRFNNPNVEQTCGCGESFSLKDSNQTQAG